MLLQQPEHCPFPTPPQVPLQSSFSSWKSYKPRNQFVFGCILVSQKGNILTVKGRVSEKWSFPKGHIEKNESTLECALRELYEETGIVPKTDYTSFKQFKHPIHKKLNTAGYYIFFVNEEDTPRIFDTEEVSEAKWLSWDELCNINGNIDISSFKRWQLKMTAKERLTNCCNQTPLVHSNQNQINLLSLNTT